MGDERKPKINVQANARKSDTKHKSNRKGTARISIVWNAKWSIIARILLSQNFRILIKRIKRIVSALDVLFDTQIPNVLYGCRSQ